MDTVSLPGHKFGHARATLSHFNGTDATLGSLWEHLGMTLAYFGITLGHCGVTWLLLWGHFEVTLGNFRIAWGHFWSYKGGRGSLLKQFGALCGHFGYMRARFQKTFVFPMDFYDFMKHWNRIGATLGTLWGHFGSLRRYFGHFGAATWSI